MNSIKHIEKIETTYSGWKPVDVAFIKSFASSGTDLAIVFYCQPRTGNSWPDVSAAFFELSLIFNHVVNLEMTCHTVSLQQVSGFTITDISEDGLEGINFRVGDYEHGTIGFYCKDIEVNEPPQKIFIR